MKTNDFSVRERHTLAYSTPTVNILNLHSEGVLCGSFDEDNFTESFDKDAWDEL